MCVSPVIIDRTADYVRRVGGTFESEILARNRGKKQFQFLENPASPYHPYYKQRVKYGPEGPPKEATEQAQMKRAEEEERLAREKKEAEERKTKEDEEKAAAAAVPKKLSLQERLRAYVDAAHKPDRAKLAEAEAKEAERIQAATNASAGAQAGLHGGAPPAAATPAAAAGPVFSYKLKHPEQYSPVDIDIIKLTALYLARCGMEFLHGLQRREARNVHFDFLKPQHVLFVYFQHLVEAYKAVIVPKRGVKDELKARVSEGQEKYFQQLLVEAVIKRKKELAELRAKEAEETERSGVSFIDWKDFVVVASIQFADAEDAYLPVPRETVEEMAAMLNAQSLEETNAADAAAGGGEDMDVDMEDDTAAPPAAAAPPAGPATGAQPPPEDEVTRLIRSAVLIPGEEVLEVRAHADDDDLGAASRQKQQVFQKCIVCGDEIAIDDLAEHMRIELLDPRWKEQKQALLDRQRESSLTADATVGVNLARMARRNQAVEQQNHTSELKARKQALQDAILLYGPQSVQAREAAARAGEIAPPPPPPQPAKPAPPPAAAPQVGAMTRPPGMQQQQPQQPPPQQQPYPSQPPPGASAHMPVRPPVGGPMAPPPPAFAMQRPPPPPQPQQQPRPPQGPPGMAPGMYPPGMMPGGAPSSAVAAPLPPPPASVNPYAAFAPPVPGSSAAAAMPFHSPFMPPPPPPAAAPAMAPTAGVPRQAPSVDQEDEQASKRQKTDAAGTVPAAAPSAAAGASKGKLLPESEFLALHPRAISVRILVPSDAAQPFKFQGQEIQLHLQLTDTVQTMKEALSKQLNDMPPNKMKLQFSAASGGVHINKDEVTLAFYNVVPDATINLGVKERGGKKK